MRIIRIENEADFDSTIKATVAEASGRVFVLLFGTEAPATGQSWCSDCVIADPLIRKSIAKISDAVLIEAPAGSRGAEYRSSKYHDHPDIKLMAVPTLIEWGKQGPLKRLVEEDCARQDLLDAFCQ
ncbi:hypothetical protein BATDEDRAFT_86770 [Batrachochytrium dendrobatidis JAM81]|uniref:Thioredoxin domain-containing protein n=2 Tax=Batrachochytrium dendrobatidis TaxID=109871 RepID=F4NYK8_BATDJ|nr:uncharacterized protein BATDEDRAFT_86770 [Batrachochytrium dendrobatidis JAM81]EGF81728.1 hypothetical protein BATDEDRAFT_86770 [Batrachochytrium dendrobatidis JAM81]KAJ8328628.1 hypothetical protein O5D80_003208 [Batrachochytrium dendrobatidis]KAK5671139.1 hypothetical protein QVD99_002900 [Batrachochytrium dendrobatidis]OAJ40180.1 hypothetical protein BDEG_23943 [Batrachochytrium dendrobatidis JEL423]|eukprot:XP_006677509.1 hypothetical protein BATDEDRAFT_86770 [Batrachochytrium dendrobatidis JAM81]